MPRSRIARSYCSSMFTFLGNDIALHSDCHDVHSHQHCRRILSSPHPLPHLLFVDFFDDGHSEQCEMLSHCSFDLHFSNNEQCWASFHMVINHLYVIFGQMFRSAHFFIGLFTFLVLSWMCCLCDLEITPLSVISFAIRFSRSEGCLFSLFIVSFTVQRASLVA